VLRQVEPAAIILIIEKKMPLLQNQKGNRENTIGVLEGSLLADRKCIVVKQVLGQIAQQKQTAVSKVLHMITNWTAPPTGYGNLLS